MITIEMKKEDVNGRVCMVKRVKFIGMLVCVKIVPYPYDDARYCISL